MLVLKILVALAAVGFGVWLGLPGRYDQTLEDIERNIELGRETQKAHRHFTPLAWIQRHVTARGQVRKPRHAFRMEHPEDR